MAEVGGGSGAGAGGGKGPRSGQELVGAPSAEGARELPTAVERVLLWAGVASIVAGLVLIVTAWVRGPRRGKGGRDAAAEGVLPVAELPAPVALTTPVPGQLRGIAGRYFRLVGPADDPLALPDPKRTQVIIDLFDAAGGLIPPAERVVLSPAPDEESGSVAWIAVDLRRMRNVTRISFAAMDPRLSQNSSRAFLQILDTDMTPICAVRFGDVESQRLIFDLEGNAARGCAEAQRRNQERGFYEEV